MTALVFEITGELPVMGKFVQLTEVGLSNQDLLRFAAQLVEHVANSAEGKKTSRLIFAEGRTEPVAVLHDSSRLIFAESTKEPLAALREQCARLLAISP
jgi:hypothetical protein